MSVDEILAAMTEVVGGAEGRPLTDDEVTRYEALEADLSAARRDGEVRARQRAYQTPARNELGAVFGASEPGRRNPLAYTREAMDGLQAALESRTSGRFPAAMTGERLRQFQNAALTTGTFGAPREWGANVLAGPRILHVVAGVPQQPIDSILAQFPQLTLPAATASVGENVSLPEYASSAAGSVTAGRFGRFTDLSAESEIGTDAGALLAMHRVGIAKDLDKVLIDAVEVAAGAAVAFTADVPAAIRKAMAKVLDSTAADDPASLVILAHPDNAHLLQDVTPTGGATIAESFQRFSGALVYPSSAVDTGFMTVANLQAGARYFEAHGVATAVDESVKTGTRTVATALIGGYGITLTADFAVKVDVVTP